MQTPTAEVDAQLAQVTQQCRWLRGAVAKSREAPGVFSDIAFLLQIPRGFERICRVLKIVMSISVE